MVRVIAIRLKAKVGKSVIQGEGVWQSKRKELLAEDLEKTRKHVLV